MHENEEQTESTTPTPSGMERFGNYVLNSIRAVVFILLICLGIVIIKYYFN